MNRRWLIAALAFSGLPLLAVVGYWLHFTQYMVYDDEGYVLWSLHNYILHGGLYTKVYSQYGPFFYVFYDALCSVTRWRLDSETARGVTLFYWCACTFLAGHFAWRQTRNALAAGAAAVLTFLSLLVMVSEPGHPGGLLALLAAVGAMGGAAAITAGQPRRFAAITALMGTAMLLTKINVGLFFLLAAGSWMIVHTNLGRWQRAAQWTVALGAVVAPLALMKTLIHERWVIIFGFVFACGALGLLTLIQGRGRQTAGMAPWWIALATAGTLAAFVIGTTWARGTSLSSLWQGMVVSPLQHPAVYGHAIRWPAIAPWLALGGLVLATLAVFIPRGPRFGFLLALLRLTAGAWLFWQVPKGMDWSLVSFGLTYGVGLVWLMVVPLAPGGASAATAARLWVAWAFVWQTLQAYPVAGSQMAWGSFLWMPLAVIGCFEALHFLTDQMPRARQAILAGASLVLVLVCGVAVNRAVYLGSQRFAQGEPLGIPGAASLRISDDFTLNLRVLTRNIHAHANTLFSFPGLFSFNLWTGRPTPTLANVTHWFSLLSSEQQQAIIDQLEDDPRAVVIVHDYLIKYLEVRELGPRGRLHDYVRQNFHAAFRLDSYEFWVRRERRIAPLGTARLHFANDGPPRLELVTDGHREIAAIEIQLLHAPFTSLMHLPLNAGSNWSLTPLALDGSTTGATIGVNQPQMVTGISRLETVLPMPASPLPPLPQLRIVLLDVAGRPVDTARFAN